MESCHSKLRLGIGSCPCTQCSPSNPRLSKLCKTRNIDYKNVPNGHSRNLNYTSNRHLPCLCWLDMARKYPSWNNWHTPRPSKCYSCLGSDILRSPLGTSHKCLYQSCMRNQRRILKGILDCSMFQGIRCNMSLVCTYPEQKLLNNPE